MWYLVDYNRNPKNFKKHRIAMVYVGEIIKKQPTEFKEHINLSNSFVHVSFMNSFLCILFLIYDKFCKSDFNP